MKKIYILVGLFSLFSLFIGVFLGKNYFSDKKITTLLPNKGKCAYYGFLEKDIFLGKYIVNKGDTLLSIATKVLENSSRVEELIALNKSTYPNLSLQNSFLEVVWVLNIPPSFINSSTGYLIGVGGEILSQNENAIELNLYAGQRGIDEGYMSYKRPYTKYMGKESFEVGDCVIAIIDSGVHENTILAISTQDTKYFEN